MIRLLRLLFAIFFSVHSVFPIFSVENLHPNSQMIDSLVCIVDTIEARKVFENMRPFFEQQISILNEKTKHLTDILNSNKNKVSSQDELLLLEEAYNYCLYAQPQIRKYKTHTSYSYDLGNLGKGSVSNFGLSGLGLLTTLASSINNIRKSDKSEEIFDKNVKKGKLTNDVRLYLSYYIIHLTKENEHIEHLLNDSSNNFNWLEFVDNPPTKYIPKKIRNRNYRGNHYYNEKILDELEYPGMNEACAFLSNEVGEWKTEAYPCLIKYLTYPSKPNLRVTLRGHNSVIEQDGHFHEIMEVYNKDGELACMPVLSRKNGKDVFNEIKRLVYLSDYKQNKYNIQSESTKVHKRISYEIGYSFLEKYDSFTSNHIYPRLNDKFKSYIHFDWAASERASQYINQLKLDHENDFGYIYIIERLSNLQFRVIFINKETLLPSVSAIVTFKTGSEPYTSTFSVKLCDVPSDIPPINTDYR
ncbi:MAG: hypothetical protein K2H38_05505 [Muribaculaceae bacterium]|nr:hypothetical protein [Muribaculaceae bacterium]